MGSRGKRSLLPVRCGFEQKRGRSTGACRSFSSYGHGSAAGGSLEGVCSSLFPSEEGRGGRVQSLLGTERGDLYLAVKSSLHHRGIAGGEGYVNIAETCKKVSECIPSGTLPGRHKRTGLSM